MPTLFQSTPSANKVPTINQTTQKTNPVTAPVNGTNPIQDPHLSPRIKMKPLAAYAEHPANLRFETQEEQESVELFLRQHPIVNIPWIIIGILLILAPSV